MTKQEAAIRLAAKQGYRVTQRGVVISPNGFERKLTLKGKSPRPKYWSFNIKLDGSSYPIRVHKLVAYFKFGDVAFESLVRHLDGDSKNNSWANIEIGTGTDNAMDRPLEDRLAHARKAAIVTRKLTNEQVLEIKTAKTSGSDLARKFGVAKSTISNIRRGKLYTDVMVV